MKREKTKDKGVYKVGKNYYIVYYVGSKSVEKKIGPHLKDALQEKLERETKVKRGKYEVIEKQEKMTFDDLMALYEKEGENKAYVRLFKQTYLGSFGTWKLSQITRKERVPAFLHSGASDPDRQGLPGMVEGDCSDRLLHRDELGRNREASMGACQPRNRSDQSSFLEDVEGPYRPGTKDRHAEEANKHFSTYPKAFRMGLLEAGWSTVSSLECLQALQGHSEVCGDRS